MRPTVLQQGINAVLAVWRWHFRIPEPAYWVLLAVTGAFFFPDNPIEALVFAAAMGLWVTGIVRWHWHRRRSRFGLVVPRFTVSGGDKSRAAGTQETIMTSLADKLGPEEMAEVHAIPAEVGTGARDFAARLRRRLRARLLLHGRIEEVAGEVGVFARVVSEIPKGVEHRDLHTRDRTPVKRSWGDLIERLTPTKGVALEEYPLEFATEIEAVVRGTAGEMALVFGDFSRAEDLLGKAIGVASASTSHRLDHLRIGLAFAKLEQGRAAEAVALLRQRAAGEDPSPDLLRTLSSLLSMDPRVPGYDTPANADEAIALLRQARELAADPQREMTMYNLSVLLSSHRDDDLRKEGQQLLEELYERSKWYRRAWYVRRTLGSDAWGRAQAARSDGDEVTAQEEYANAARFYAAALRARPRFQFMHLVTTPDGPVRMLYTRFPQSPVMRANTWEAHREAGHAWRARWHRWRLWRIQLRLLKQGFKRLGSGQWQPAYARFDWVVTGANDFTNNFARVYRAVARHQMGEDAEALKDWKEARDAEPYALVLRAALLRDPEKYPLERGLPGTDETNLDKVLEQLGAPPQAGQDAIKHPLRSLKIWTRGP